MAARLTRARRRSRSLESRTGSCTDRTSGPYRRRSLGHSPPLYDRSHVTVGENLSEANLVERALDLARMLHGLLPEDSEATSLLALILLTDSRRSARVGARVSSSRSPTKIDRNGIVTQSMRTGLVGQSIRRGRPGRFTLMAPSLPFTRARRTGTKPTGPKSSDSTTYCSRRGRRPSSH